MMRFLHKDLDSNIQDLNCLIDEKKSLQNKRNKELFKNLYKTKIELDNYKGKNRNEFCKDLKIKKQRHTKINKVININLVQDLLNNYSLDKFKNFVNMYLYNNSYIGDEYLYQLVNNRILNMCDETEIDYFYIQLLLSLCIEKGRYTNIEYITDIIINLCEKSEIYEDNKDIYGCIYYCLIILFNSFEKNIELKEYSILQIFNNIIKYNDIAERFFYDIFIITDKNKLLLTIINCRYQNSKYFYNNIYSDEYKNEFIDLRKSLIELIKKHKFLSNSEFNIWISESFTKMILN